MDAFAPSINQMNSIKGQKTKAERGALKKFASEDDMDSGRIDHLDEYL